MQNAKQMKQKATLIVLSLLTICLNSNSQTIQIPDSIIIREKAKYMKEDLTKFLYNNIKYPKEGLMKNIQGDVVISFIINRNGKLDSLKIENSSDFSLSTSSIAAINLLDDEWIPAKVNNTPTDKKYLIVFRFRIYFNSQPYDYKVQSGKFFEKHKYEKSLKLYNKGIMDNKYDFELFESRSKVKEILGDTEGAKNDQLISLKLNDEIMSIIDVIGIGVTRVERRIVGSEIRTIQY
jgi:TonB family protein